MKITVVSHFDKNYVSQGIAMMRSIRSLSSLKVIFCCICHDEESIRMVERENREAGDSDSIQFLTSNLIDSSSELKLTFQNRNRIEFLYALSPFIVEYAINKIDSDVTVYVDADIYFYGDIKECLLPIIEGNKKVIFVEHRFKVMARNKMKYGKFNVGLVAFKNESDAKLVIEMWKNMCMAGTPQTLKDGMFGDQLYLEEIAKTIKYVYSESRKGHNEAAWNCEQRISSKGEVIFTDGARLIYYHFSGLKIGKFLANSQFAAYGEKMLKATRDLVYKPYCRNIRRIRREYAISNYRIRKSLPFKELIKKVYKLDIFVF